ncbi:MAG: hypothetical protein ABIO79_04465, partial [Ferruginibacter sp.]
FCVDECCDPLQGNRRWELHNQKFQQRYIALLLLGFIKKTKKDPVSPTFSKNNCIYFFGKNQAKTICKSQ